RRGSRPDAWRTELSPGGQAACVGRLGQLRGSASRSGGIAGRRPAASASDRQQRPLEPGIRAALLAPKLQLSSSGVFVNVQGGGLFRLFASERRIAMTRATVAPARPMLGDVSTWVSLPTYQAYEILHIGFAVLPIVAGLDKFLHFLQIGSWENYLAPIVTRVSGLEAHTFMLGVGVVEIIAGLLVAFWPRVGGY